MVSICKQLSLTEKKTSQGSIPVLKETQSVEQINNFEKGGSWYFKLPAKYSQTVGHALPDSPVGQAAWTLETMHAWPEHSGHSYHIYTKGMLLDSISLYQFTGSTASCRRLRRENDQGISVPVDISVGVGFHLAEVSAPCSRSREGTITNTVSLRKSSKEMAISH